MRILGCMGVRSIVMKWGSLLLSSPSAVNLSMCFQAEDRNFGQSFGKIQDVLVIVGLFGRLAFMQGVWDAGHFLDWIDFVILEDLKIVIFRENAVDRAMNVGFIETYIPIVRCF